jgi:hypothetical protein
MGPVALPKPVCVCVPTKPWADYWRTPESSGSIQQIARPRLLPKNPYRRGNRRRCMQPEGIPPRALKPRWRRLGSVRCSGRSARAQNASVGSGSHTWLVMVQLPPRDRCVTRAQAYCPYPGPV